MAVHEARRDDLALGVEHLPRAFADAADRYDLAVAHADVRPIAGQAGTVDHRAILDYEVIGHCRRPPMDARPGKSCARGLLFASAAW
jgi:hypothetical protein